MAAQASYRFDKVRLAHDQIKCVHAQPRAYIMKKNKLGRTGLNISQVILGGGWVGGLFIDPKYEVMEKAIEFSLKSGINWIDTAESYSDGQSEKNIGDLLSSLSSENKLHVSSKARLDPSSTEWEKFC